MRGKVGLLIREVNLQSLSLLGQVLLEADTDLSLSDVLENDIEGVEVDKEEVIYFRDPKITINHLHWSGEQENLAIKKEMNLKERSK